MVNNASSPRKPLNMVLLTPTLDGGVGRVISLIARGMNESGISVAIWTLSGGAYESEAKQWSQITYLSTKQARGAMFPLIKLLRRHKPGVVLSVSFHLNCIAIIAKMIAGVKTHLYISEHTSLDTGFATLSIVKRFLIKNCVRALYKRADGCIAVSHGVAQHMAKYANISLESIRVIYNPVITPEMMKISEEPVEHPFFEMNESVLLAVGRLSTEKDYPTLLEAFKLVNATIPSRLIIIGEGPQRNQIEKYINTSEISDRVSLLGMVSNPYSYFRHSDLYVLSSIREGLPTTLIEALALGTPAVSTDAHSGPREILNDGDYGTLVPIKDGKILAEAIIKTLKSPRTKIPDYAIDPFRLKQAIHDYLHVLFPTQY